jgi:hypothetical protein
LLIGFIVSGKVLVPAFSYVIHGWFMWNLLFTAISWHSVVLIGYVCIVLQCIFDQCSRYNFYLKRNVLKSSSLLARIYRMHRLIKTVAVCGGRRVTDYDAYSRSSKQLKIIKQCMNRAW